MADTTLGGHGVPLKEQNNYKEGRSGGQVPITKGPAVGHTSGNETKGGGINRAAQGGNAPRG